MPLISEFRYRPDIDGLRALAVMSVLLFHAGFGFTGGYVGVDVFFVISGYLITSLIWKDLEADKFSFAHFWERRARRIVPAAVVLTVLVLIVGFFVLMPNDYKELGRSAKAQAGFSANIFFLHRLDYFAGPADTKPLLHTWSLAVEEQFYLIVPWIFWALYRFASVRRRGTILAILGVGFLVSFGLSVYDVSFSFNANTAFYLLPSRAWELLAGSILAFVPAATGRLQAKGLREVLSLAGLGLILWPVLFYTPETPFPGLAALWPCLGAALLIWVNANNLPTLVGRVLSIKPIVFIGLISYSLYLWHWPILAMSRYHSLGAMSATHRVILLAAAFVGAIFSYWLVETPFRKRKVGASRPAIFAYAGVGLAVMFLFGELSPRLWGLTAFLPPKAQAYALARTDMAIRANMSADDVRQNRFVQFGANDSTQKPEVLLWGDSHAMAMLPALDWVFKQDNRSGIAALRPGDRPVLDWVSDGKNGLPSDPDAVAFNDAVFEYIQTHAIGHVILISRWSASQKLADERGEGAAYNQAIIQTVQRLVDAGVDTWFVQDVPNQPFDVPQALMQSALFGTNVGLFCTKPSPEVDRDGLAPETLQAMRDAGAKVINPKPYFLSPDGSHYIIESRGIALYWDDSHLSTQGALLMIRPFLQAELELDHAGEKATQEATAEEDGHAE